MIHIQTIPMLPMTRNERDRAHWGSRRRELNDWVLLVSTCPEATRQKPGDPKRLVEIVFHKKRPPLSDDDNRVSRCKVPLDAIVRRGWLVDDSPEFCKLEAREEIGQHTQTVIAISEMTEGVTKEHDTGETFGTAAAGKG